jgi:hypothetical protein
VNVRVRVSLRVSYNKAGGGDRGLEDAALLDLFATPPFTSKRIAARFALTLLWAVVVLVVRREDEKEKGVFLSVSPGSGRPINA